MTVDTTLPIPKNELQSAISSSLQDDYDVAAMMSAPPAEALPVQQQQQEQVVETKAETKTEEEVVPTSMGEAWRVFLLGSYNGPRLVSIMIAVMAFWRVVILPQQHEGVNGGALLPLNAMDAVVFISTIIFWCIQEHVLHGKMLHSKLDWYGKAIHEAHHAKPYHHVSLDPAWLMMTWLCVTHVLLRIVIFPHSLSLALTSTVAYASAGLWYEFLHYIVHTKVRFSKNSYLRRMKDHHARHHLVDSRYWLGFSLPAVDDLFDTNPTMSQVRQWHKEQKKKASERASQKQA
jgi:Fatty acid hydroxylase superfamily